MNLFQIFDAATNRSNEQQMDGTYFCAQLDDNEDDTKLRILDLDDKPPGEKRKTY